MDNKISEEMVEMISQVRDEADLAQFLAMQEQEANVERARNLLKKEEHPDFDGIHCLDCDCEIPPRRLQLQKIRCVDCQEYLDKKNKRR